jgi:biopolymer transport protein ExbB
MKPLPRGLLISGLVLCLGAPLTGFLFTIMAMIGAFHVLGQSGISDPKILAGHIGNALMATMSGIVIGVAVGMPLIIAGVVTHFATKPRPQLPNP